MQATDSDEPGLNEPLEDATQSSRDSFIGDGNADGELLELLFFIYLTYIQLLSMTLQCHISSV